MFVKVLFHWPVVITVITRVPSGLVTTRTIPDRALFESCLAACLEFEPADTAAADHAFIMNYIAVHDFGHYCQIEVVTCHTCLAGA
jgi:hypothetical protein